jgi:hypothetical protein
MICASAWCVEVRSQPGETGDGASRRSTDMTPPMAYHRQQKYPRLYKIKPILWVEVDAQTIMALGVRNRRVLPQCQGWNVLVGLDAGGFTNSLVLGETLAGQGDGGEWAMGDGQWSMVNG